MYIPFRQRVERWIGRNILSRFILNGSIKVIFLIGHMRSGSSLLTHILTSNKGIKGYGETHIKYEDERDFGTLYSRIMYMLLDVYISEEYILDKVLHKRLVKEVKLLDNKSVRMIFIVRRPDMAISSVLKNMDFVDDVDEAYERYGRQIEWVEGIARRLSSRKWTYTTYSELTQHTETVFSRIESLLELSEPLSGRYQKNRYTGTPKIGDSGPHIETGHVKRDIDREVDPRVYPYLDRANEKFESCLRVLKNGGMP